MAFSTKALLSLVTLLVLATSQAHGLAIGGVSVTTLVLRVGLHCQLDPAAAVSGNSPGLTDATVTLLLNGQPIASSSTDLDGRSIITINSGFILGNILNLSGLSVRVSLPIASCAVWAHTNGALLGPVLQVGNVVGGVLGLTCNTLHLVA